MASFMYIPTNEERAFNLENWANSLLTNPENSHMPKRYLNGIRRRALAEAKTIVRQPELADHKADSKVEVVPESFIEMLAQPIEED